MRIDILTLFPDMFDGVLNQSILKKAQEKKAVHFNLVNFRDYSDDKHGRVDDYPYGGGAGMVLAPQPIFSAVEAVIDHRLNPKVILMCPQGERFNQQKAHELAKEKQLIFICGHYEGFDERIRSQLATDELSIGDYVLTGGELACMVVIDSITRLLPGVLGNEESHKHDSFSNGLLEYPQYTRPRNFRGHVVPDILLSGDHEKIEQWRKRESFKRTAERRPELLSEKQRSQLQKWDDENR